MSETHAPGGPSEPDGSSGQPADDAGGRGVRDLGLGLVLLATTAALAYSAANDADMHQNFGLDPGPAFLPDLLIWMLGIGAAILVVQGFWRLSRAGWQAERPIIDVARTFVPALMIVSIILYVLLVPAIGFLAVSLLFSIVWALGLAAQDHRLAVKPLLVSVAGSIAIAVAIYLTFERLIGIPLG